VLAVDQTFKQEKDTKTVIGKTATLEVAPDQAQKVEAAENLGTLSLSLRPLAEAETPVASNTSDDGAPQISVIRYGVAHSDAGVAQGGKSQ
jgi:pilus assembly protein CpaB